MRGARKRGNMKNNISRQIQPSHHSRLRRLLNYPLAVLGTLTVAFCCASPFASVAAHWWPFASDQAARPEAPGQSPDDGPKFEPGTLIVKLKPGVAAPVATQVAQGSRLASALLLPGSLQALNRKYRVGQVGPVFNPAMASSAAIERLLTRPDASARQAIPAEPAPRLDHIFKLALDAQTALLQAAQEYAADPNVEYAEPSWLAQTSLNPNDDLFPNLWGMIKVGAPQAWDYANGQGVVIAVVDSGINANHPELKARLWQNVAEAGGQPGVDDDGNGFVDDINGWDFAYGDNYPDDKLSHGTHVAGIIAAEGNNAAGVIGLAYKARIMPLKAIDDSNNGATPALANAILYAINKQAKVINNSWGGTGQNLTIANVIKLAHQAGIVVVSAAGNSSQDAMNFYPANQKRSLAVAAFDVNDKRAWFSNFGHELDVAAPGVGVISTVPNASSVANPLFDSFGNKYAAFDGTSMAAPHVSALAALLIQNHSNWTNEEIRQAIRQSADDTSNPGFDTEGGYGRINALKAVLEDNTAPPTALLTEPANYQKLKGLVPVKGYAGAPGGVFKYSVEIGAGEFPTSYTVLTTSSAAQTGGLLHNLNTSLFPDGLYNLRIVTTDAYSGKHSVDHVVVTIDNVFIASPIDHQVLANGIFQINGQINGGITGSGCTYTLEWASGCNATKYFKTITSGPVLSNNVTLIGLWNTAAVPDGEITLRLTVTCDSVVSVDQICVVVDKLLANGWPVKIDHSPAVKSPKIADLDGDNRSELILGASVFNIDGSVKPGWTNVPGAGRTNPAILNVDGVPKTLEVVAAVYDDDPNKSYPDTPVVTAYRYDKSVLWSFPVINPDVVCAGKNKSIPSSVSAADVDGDGQPEIVFTALFPDCMDDFHTWVFVLNAKTGAVKKQFAVNGLTKSSVALADVDRNGATDLIIATADFDWAIPQWIGRMTVVKYDGTPLAGWPRQVLDTKTNYNWQDIDPVAADVDGDCHYEILVGQHLWRDNGQPVSNWPEGSLALSTGAFAPLPDGDSYLEVIGGGANGVNYKVFDHNAAYKSLSVNGYENKFFWADPLVINVYSSIPKGIAASIPLVQGNPVVADIDGNGQMEIVRGSQLGSSTPNIGMPLYGRNPLTGQNSAGFPRFVTTTNSKGSSDPILSTVAVGDLDKDGYTDLVAAAAGKLYVWNLGKKFSPSLSYWPMFQRDLRNTGTAPIPNYVFCPIPVDKSPIPNAN